MEEAMKTKRIGVLLGGVSAEREISIKTGEAIHAALVRRGYDAHKIYVDADIDLDRDELDIEGDSTGVTAAPSLGGGGFNWVRSASGFDPAIDVSGDLELSSTKYTDDTDWPFVAPLAESPLIDQGTSAGLDEGDPSTLRRTTRTVSIDGAPIATNSPETITAVADTPGTTDVRRGGTGIGAA